MANERLPNICPSAHKMHFSKLFQNLVLFKTESTEKYNSNLIPADSQIQFLVDSKYFIYFPHILRIKLQNRNFNG